MPLANMKRKLFQSFFISSGTPRAITKHGKNISRRESEQEAEILDPYRKALL